MPPKPKPKSKPKTTPKPAKPRAQVKSKLTPQDRDVIALAECQEKRCSAQQKKSIDVITKNIKPMVAAIDARDFPRARQIMMDASGSKEVTALSKCSRAKCEDHLVGVYADTAKRLKFKPPTRPISDEYVRQLTEKKIDHQIAEMKKMFAEIDKKKKRQT